MKAHLIIIEGVGVRFDFDLVQCIKTGDGVLDQSQYSLDSRLQHLPSPLILERDVTKT